MSTFEPVEILLVEDSDTDAEVALRALRRAHLGNQVVWVKDGAEALGYLFRTGEYADRPNGEPRLVLLDIKMPKIDGLETLRQIRERDPQHRIPVVMLTSSAEESDLLRSYQLGVNSYVVKPVDFIQLSEQIVRLGFYWLAMNRVPSS